MLPMYFLFQLRSRTNLLLRRMLGLGKPSQVALLRVKLPHKPVTSNFLETLSYNVVKSGVKVTWPARLLLGKESADTVVPRHALMN